MRELKYELKTTREQLQNTIEEMESCNDELNISNEGTMDMNEELQSVKDELQSLYAELSNVRAELQDKREELENTTSDMANLIANVDTAMLFLGADLTIRRFTPGATRLFSLTDSDRGRPFSNTTLRFADPQLAQDISLVLQDLTPREREVRGETDQWYLRRVSPYRTVDKRIDGVVLTVTEITELKRAQLDLQQMTTSLEKQMAERTELLHEERNFTDTVLDIQPASVVVLDYEGRVLRFNKACEAATGYALKELRGTLNWWDLLIPAEEKEGVQEVVAKLQSGETDVRHENHWRHRDGSRRLFSWRNTVIKNADGQVQYIIGTGVDITDQRKVEQDARQHLEEASRLQRLQTANELASMLAHEINQPLAAISVFADASQRLLEHVPADQDRVAEILQQIERQAIRAGEIIRRLRGFVSRGKVEEAVPLDLNRVILGVCELMIPKADSRSIRIDLELNEVLPPVLGVSVHIEQVLLNLLRNAIDAIRDAGMAGGCISVETRREDDMAQVSVCDSGPGIGPETAATMFDSLTSTKEYGLGVGLRISRSLVEAQGGRLWVEPRTPGGIFHFVLPLAP